MSRDVALTVISLIAGIATSLAFYFLQTRQARRKGWHLAKARIVGDLAPSLGQGCIPPREAILATIRSVMREHDLPDNYGVKYNEIIEELLRQVTADAFLETERRIQLQAALVSILLEHASKSELPLAHGDGAVISTVEDGEGVVAGDHSSELPELLARFAAGLSYLHWTTFVIGLALGLIVAIVVNPYATLNVLAPIDALVDLLLDGRR